MHPSPSIMGAFPLEVHRQRPLLALRELDFSLYEN